MNMAPCRDARPEICGFHLDISIAAAPQSTALLAPEVMRCCTRLPDWKIQSGSSKTQQRWTPRIQNRFFHVYCLRKTIALRAFFQESYVCLWVLPSGKASSRRQCRGGESGARRPVRAARPPGRATSRPFFGRMRSASRPKHPIVGGAQSQPVVSDDDGQSCPVRLTKDAA